MKSDGTLYALVVYKDGSAEMVMKPVGAEYTKQMTQILHGKIKKLRVGCSEMLLGYHGEVIDYYDWLKKHRG